MISLSKLYQIAQDQNIVVDCFDLKKRGALSMMDDGKCFIAINPYRLQSTQEERVTLAHELGHCVTGSFYNIYATADNRQRHENRADKWAVRQLIPMDALNKALEDGCTELWELAERFGVTEEYIRKALCLYVHGNLATELYF